MELIKMNADNAKMIGAIAAKDLVAKCSPGEILIEILTGRTLRLPTSEDKDALQDLRLTTGTYFRRAADMKKSITTNASLKALSLEKRVKELEAELEKTTEQRDKVRAEMQQLAIAGASEIIVVFFQCKETMPMMKVSDVNLREGDELVCFGRRYKDTYGRSLWIALIKVKGVTTDSIKRFYTWDYRYARSINKEFYSYVQSLKSTGYKPDSFQDGVGYILVDKGVELKEPIDLDSAREKERKKIERREKRAAELRRKNMKTTEEKAKITKIFAYRGVLGIESGPKLPGIIARPTGGNLGVVVDAASCEITTDAKEMFRNAGREGGSFSAFMLTKHSSPKEGESKSSIGWMGGYISACEASELTLGRDCDKGVIEDMKLNDDMELPKSFVDYVNEMKDGEKEK